MIHLPIFFRVASPALGQSHDCPSSSEATTKHMDIIDQYLSTSNHNKIRILFMGCTASLFLRSRFCLYQWIQTFSGADKTGRLSALSGLLCDSFVVIPFNPSDACKPQWPLFRWMNILHQKLAFKRNDFHNIIYGSFISWKVLQCEWYLKNCNHPWIHGRGWNVCDPFSL